MLPRCSIVVCKRGQGFLSSFSSSYSPGPVIKRYIYYLSCSNTKNSAVIMIQTQPEQRGEREREHRTESKREKGQGKNPNVTQEWRGWGDEICVERSAGEVKRTHWATETQSIQVEDNTLSLAQRRSHSWKKNTLASFIVLKLVWSINRWKGMNLGRIHQRLVLNRTPRQALVQLFFSFKLQQLTFLTAKTE